jgi:hypothetical protein
MPHCHPLPTRLALALALALSQPGLAGAAPVYHLVDLGKHFTVNDMNKNGVVVGYKHTDLGDQPMIWRNGHWNPVLKGADGMATAVDVDGDVVGETTRGQPMLWVHGSAEGILVVPKYKAEVVALAGVNDSELVVGSDVEKRDRSWHCFTWQNGGTTKDLQVPNCVAGRINRNGWIIGEGTSPAGHNAEGFIWTGNHFHWFEDHPSAVGVDINDENHVAGDYDSPEGPTHAFIYDGAQFTDIGTVPGGTGSSARKINSHDEVLGTATKDGDEVIFVRTGGENLELLPLIDNLEDWDLTVPIGMDDDGNIVGWGNRGGGGHSWMAVRVAD